RFEVGQARCRHWWRFRLRVRLALGPFVGPKAESGCRPPAEQFCSNALALSEYVLELHFRCIDRSNDVRAVLLQRDTSHPRGCLACRRVGRTAHKPVGEFCLRSRWDKHSYWLPAKAVACWHCRHCFLRRNWSATQMSDSSFSRQWGCRWSWRHRCHWSPLCWESLLWPC